MEKLLPAASRHCARCRLACVESGALATDMCPVPEFRIITLIPEDNNVSGSPLVAKPCSLHPGNVIGAAISPLTGGTPGTVTDPNAQIDTGGDGSAVITTDPSAQINTGQ